MNAIQQDETWITKDEKRLGKVLDILETFEREQKLEWEKSKAGGKRGNPKHLETQLKCVSLRGQLLGLYTYSKPENN